MPHQQQSGGSRFRIEPDPPIQGEPLRVTYLGPASEIEYQVDGDTTVTVTPGSDGSFEIDPVPRGSEIALSDNRGLPGYLHRPIVFIDNS